ncbi:hypothetical protein KKJ06_18410 [Xenorhabdus bovienii]|uniref:hypothetical protein n=1 Tax=Xenorhabdus bovienii TaxID=40576 RepID=UPI00237C6B19|nr:hypothetical protein [Xenorhabdus bovienii]MDE1493103.1 hypothetical protein [Xenorhabdus bovienii]MDE9478735.1 hypothetical protein [Xenorhabdus bovienii]MDE9483264.1 hypothetical protein [Xenorhabdus bovienii]MDE9531688.1 hypothetical protein [Xenorhabdus bovienii]MDE9552768.1 hypothetical protein [Xenorhabdus bovienii]
MNNVSKINPTQVRIPLEVEEGILRTAKKYMRTKHADIVYRLKLLDELEKKGEIII